jgi:hypothetical protein
MKNIKIKDKELLIMMAFRYALGGRTYAVSYIVGIILDNWDKFDDSRKEQFKREILEHERLYDNLGDDCDKQQWYKIVKKE